MWYKNFVFFLALEYLKSKQNNISKLFPYFLKCSIHSYTVTSQELKWLYILRKSRAHNSDFYDESFSRGPASTARFEFNSASVLKDEGG